jgi:flagellar L-ring protein precursor FlgH
MRSLRLSSRPLASWTIAVLSLPALSACAATREAVLGPTMSPMSYPAPLVAAEQPVILPTDGAPRRTTANSLWRAGSRTFFADQRAGKVGDILTVMITIDDSANVTNGTTRERKTSNAMGVPHFFGLESSLGKILPQAFSPTNAIQTNADSSLTGTGQIQRADKINLTIAAVVTKVLPNGNLVIQGKQEVKTNNDLRELTVAGVVRPEDISSANTISHTQIAEARIAYGGRGDLQRANTTPWGQGVMETFSPF